MRLIGGIAALLFSISGMAQEAGTPSYPKDYFRNPLDIPIFLAGNFGECRPGHFHSGLDIKTQGRENLSVHAAAGGYISRIKTEKGGFGHAIYITHPNGYTTLYAHLNKFMPSLQAYLRKMQYEKKNWHQDISFPPEKFPVSKGQQIAWSGNTGASSAPHLHFEIRSSKTEHPLNPQLFGLEVVDKIAPVPAEVVLYSGNIYDRQLASYTLAKKGDAYKPVKSADTRYTINADTIDAPEGLLGIGINADDYMEGSENTITFYTAEVLMDDQPQAMVTLDDIGYDVSRYMHAYTDFYARQVNHKWIQCLFRVPGNRLSSIFTSLNDHNGRLSVDDGKNHKVSVVLTDNSGNVTNILFYVRPVKVENKRQDTEGCVPFYAERTNGLNNPNISFSLDGRELYDDICFSTSVDAATSSLSDRFRLHYPYIPLHHYFEISIKPNSPVPTELADKVVLMYSDGKDVDGMDARRSDKGWYSASVRNFGTYWLDIDTIPPVIRSMQKSGANLAKAKQIAFTVRDATTSVKTFKGLLDGKWICFEQHGSDFFYEFDEHCSKGKHELVFKAADDNGNESEFSLRFTR
jgi:hypothetical protein